MEVEGLGGLIRLGIVVVRLEVARLWRFLLRLAGVVPCPAAWPGLRVTCQMLCWPAMQSGVQSGVGKACAVICQCLDAEAVGALSIRVRISGHTVAAALHCTVSVLHCTASVLHQAALCADGQAVPGPAPVGS